MEKGQWVLASLLMVGIVTAAAESYGVGGSDNGGCYSYSDTVAPLDGNAPTFSFTDISGSGTPIGLGDDQVSGAIPIGFTFDYYGSSYTDVQVSSNGFITFLTGQSAGCCSGQSIPNPGDPNAIVAGWWEDLFPPGGGSVHYQTLGSSPNRVFIVQFTAVPHYCCSADPVTLEFKLFETSNDVEVHYSSAPTDGGTHSAGIENEDGTIGIQWLFGTGVSAGTTAVRYFPEAGVSSDGDTDGAVDCVDNCPSDPNPSQDDADGDGAGDACDPCLGTGTVDTDSDGLCDGDDPCPTDPTQACATLFACTGTGASASTLYRLNPSTGIGVPVGAMGIFGCSGLAFHPITEELYAVGFDNSSIPSLFTVDVSTGAATLVGSTGQSQASDIAFRSDGELFSYHRFAMAAGTVSATTGSVTLLGSTGLGFDNGNGITFDQSDDLLHAGTSLNSIDQTTGAGTPVSPLAFPGVACSFPRINSMDTHASGTVYGILNCSGGQDAPNYLVTIGVPGGSVAAIAPSVPGLDGIAFTPQGECGDGMPDFGEQCDDGNILDADCCSSTCQFEAAGNACPGDGSLCTIDECDGAGTCVSTLPTGCKLPGKSILLLKDNSDNAKDKLVFKWLRGPQTDQSDFGDPLNTADYALCLYTGALMTPLTDLMVPANSTKWKPLSTKGYKYKDSGGSADGVTRVLVKGGTAGKAKALVKGKGMHLPDPTFGNLPLPVTAQLVNSQTAACFEATYDSAGVKKNDAGQFKAKAP